MFIIDGNKEIRKEKRNKEIYNCYEGGCVKWTDCIKE